MPPGPKSYTCFFFSDISIFLRRKYYTRFFFSGISIFRNLCVCQSYKQHDFSIYIIIIYIYIIIYIFIYIRSTVRRALNLLRASFSPIFQYFSAVNITRVSFSPVFQYFVTYVYVRVRVCAMRHAPRNCIVGHGFFDLEFVGHGFVSHRCTM